ncbi:hypothetical protein [Streptomyces sp. uw30]|uniref:hypothetical protein n=1 Tax=Streptomyces sp. uw30 TaxID=1828179 RepID=UPI0011CDB055|nr:hypothetical protein [Streptomyces sp. uw30]
MTATKAGMLPMPPTADDREAGGEPGTSIADEVVGEAHQEDGIAAAFDGEQGTRAEEEELGDGVPEGGLDRQDRLGVGGEADGDSDP